MEKNIIIEKFIEDWRIEATEWAYKMKEEYKAKRKELGILKTQVWCSENGISQKLVEDFRLGTDLEEVYRREANRKYNQFIEKIEKKVGEVEEENLFIGVDCNINGWVKGTKGSAKVSTILAGGYNIQCRHYRVLVK